MLDDDCDVSCAEKTFDYEKKKTTTMFKTLPTFCRQNVKTFFREIKLKLGIVQVFVQVIAKLLSMLLYYPGLARFPLHFNGLLSTFHDFVVNK